MDGELVLVSEMKAAPSHGIVIDACDSDVFDSSVLECRVYAKHKIGSDDFIGSIRETIESLLAEAAGGGWHYLAC